MKKYEVLRYCEEKAEEGWLTHKMLLEIFDNDEEIPDDLVDLICHKPEPLKSLIIYGSAEMIRQFNRAVEEFLLTLVHIEIKDKYKNNKIDS